MACNFVQKALLTQITSLYCKLAGAIHSKKFGNSKLQLNIYLSNTTSIFCLRA